jgi:hypothetical protein
MRLIKMFGLTSVAAVVAMAFVGVTSASAVSTQLCTVSTGSLLCGAGNAVASVHQVLATGTVGELLAEIPILCLGYLVEATAGALGNGATKQTISSISQSFTGCGWNSTHSTCSVTVPVGQQPVFGLLKVGLDEGTLTGISGQARLVCSSIGIDCLFDIGGMSFEATGGHLKANEASTTELGGKFFCPNEGLLDALLETLGNAYVLG